MGKFGWSYPPGCHSVPGDEPSGPCEVCGYDVDAGECICPECPRCGSYGDPNCYKEPDLGICGELHGKLSWEQQIGKAKQHIRELEDQLCDAQQALDWLEEKASDHIDNKK